MPDAIIAAIAVLNNAALITRNVNDLIFLRIFESVETARQNIFN